MNALSLVGCIVIVFSAAAVILQKQESQVCEEKGQYMMLKEIVTDQLNDRAIEENVELSFSMEALKRRTSCNIE